MRPLNCLIAISAILLLAGCGGNTTAPETPGGVTVSTDGTFAIDSVTPARAPEGTTITIHGGNFGANAKTVKVLFGDREAEVVSFSDTAIVAIVPEGAVSAPVTVAIGSRRATSPMLFTMLPPQYTMATISIEGMTITLEETRTPDEPHTSTSAELFGLHDSLGCGAAGCARRSGDTMVLDFSNTSGDMYSGTIWTRHAITLVIDTVSRRMRSVIYVTSISTTGGGGTIGSRSSNTSSTDSYATLTDLPYIPLPDGSMVVTLAGSAITGHVTTMGRGASSRSQSGPGYPTFEHDTRTIAIAPYTPASRITVTFR